MENNLFHLLKQLLIAYSESGIKTRCRDIYCSKDTFLKIVYKHLHHLNWYKEAGYSELLPHCNLCILDCFPSSDVKKNTHDLPLRRLRQNFCRVGFLQFTTQSEALRKLQINSRQFLPQGVYGHLRQ